MTALGILWIVSIVILVLCYREAAKADREDGES